MRIADAEEREGLLAGLAVPHEVREPRLIAGERLEDDVELHLGDGGIVVARLGIDRPGIHGRASRSRGPDRRLDLPFEVAQGVDVALQADPLVAGQAVGKPLEISVHEVEDALALREELLGRGIRRAAARGGLHEVAEDEAVELRRDVDRELRLVGAEVRDRMAIGRPLHAHACGDVADRSHLSPLVRDVLIDRDAIAESRGPAAPAADVAVQTVPAGQATEDSTLVRGTRSGVG
jgi:hypothetical protein